MPTKKSAPKLPTYKRGPTGPGNWRDATVPGKAPKRRGGNLEKMPTYKKGPTGPGSWRDATVPGGFVPRGGMPRRPAGYFGGGAAGLAKRAAYQATRKTLAASNRGAKRAQQQTVRNKMSGKTSRGGLPTQGRQTLSSALNRRSSVRGAIGKQGGPGMANRQALRSATSLSKSKTARKRAR